MSYIRFNSFVAIANDSILIQKHSSTAAGLVGSIRHARSQRQSQVLRSLNNLFDTVISIIQTMLLRIKATNLSVASPEEIHVKACKTLPRLSVISRRTEVCERYYSEGPC